MSSKKGTDLGSTVVGSRLVSKTDREQSEDFTCWAYSTATMIHNSVRLLILKAFQERKIDESTKKELLDIIDEKSFHREMRSELLLVVFPINMKPKNYDDEDQVDTAIVIERVSFFFRLKINPVPFLWQSSDTSFSFTTKTDFSFQEYIFRI